MVKSNVIKLPPAMQAEMREQVRIDRARENNKQVALALIAAGIPVLFTNPRTKRPLVVAHTTLDTDMTEEEREANRREFFDEHRFDPLHVGCTVDRATVRRILRAKPDATPAISCGPAGLLVIDNDVKERDGVLRNGVEEFDAFCEAHGGIPAGAIAVESQGKGRHLYFGNTESRGSSAGILKRQCETDVKGAGGYVVAPGVIRPHDGRAYGSRRDLDALIEAHTKGKLIPIPQFIADAIGRKGEADTTNERDIQALADRLRQAELPDGGDLLEPALDGLDFTKLTARYEKLHSAIEASDRSEVRFNLAVAVKTERPQTTAEEFAAILMAREECGTFVDEEKPSQGEYGWRNIARDWSRATPHKGGKSSDGEGFGAVDDESDGETAEDDSDGGEWFDNAINIPVDLDINKLPPRPYLYGKFLMRGHVTLLSAAGGIGKSAWTLDAAIDLACGVDHLGAGEFKPRKVLVYNGEDDQDEMLRRVGAQFVHHNFTPEMRAMVRENLTIISGVKASMRLAEYKDGRVVIKEKAFRKLAEIVEARGIDIVILDPLIALHSIPENANSEMNVVMMRFKNLAATEFIALLLAHHDKKNIGNKSVDDANQDDARGAGTITTPVRVILSMRRLSKRDAQALNIPPEDAPHVIALSSGAKSNYSARDVVPKLFRAHSVQADNATDEFAADSTVALAVYAPPLRKGGIGDEATLKVLAALDGSEPVGFDSRHANWIGRLIADAAGWDVEAKGVRDTVRGIIADWTARDWISETVLEASGKGADRRKRVKVYTRGAAKPVQRVYEFDAVDDEDDEA